VTSNDASPNTTDLGPIGVNLLWCIPGDVGGSEQYLVRQLAGALEARPGLDLTLFGSADLQRKHSARLAGARWTTPGDDGRRRWRRVVTEHGWLHRRTTVLRLVQHGGGTAPMGSRRPFVLTIHDLQYRTFPEYFSPLKRRYLDALIPGAARRAALVTVPTEYVRQSVVDEFGVAAERVVVVPHGVEPELLVDRTDEATLRSRFALGDGPVLVYPAMSAPHKNHRFLIDLMSTEWTDPDLRLIFIGGGGAAADDVHAAIAAADVRAPGRIRHLGRVSDADKNGLIALADALVFPSTYEGFGAPVIEAMALGAPVLCSDATCLPDVAGDAAVVAPLTAEAWSAGLDEVRARRDELIAAGRERVGHFTSRASGEAVLGAYERAEGG
jgi:alpha-1,3-rhamnosyl/mannosyltransferase